MKLYKLEDRFDTKTGKLKDPIMVWTGNYICDYTGRLIDVEADLEGKPQYSLTVNYCHDSEEVYYYDGAKQWFSKLDINYDMLFDAPFTFFVNQTGFQDASFSLVSEWMTNINNEKSIFHDCKTIEEAMRISRVRVVETLIKEKKYDVSELGLGLHLYNDRRHHITKDIDEID